MLTREENDLITRTGPGTAMGELFRRFWLPCMLASELPSPDCPPARVRLLGEDLVGFRDTSGRLGLIQEACGHRCASLFLARNEENGLRCIYHGWKYDVTGQCIDMPNEPPESRFKEKVKLKAYPLREQGGVLWAYLGPTEKMPAKVPQLEWSLVPESHRMIGKRISDHNYFQALEGGVDTSHVGFLHKQFEGSIAPQSIPALFADTSPRFTIQETEYGLIIAGRRTFEDKFVWRITHYLVPTFTTIGAFGMGYYAATMSVPRDDSSVIFFSPAWQVDRPLNDEERRGLTEGDSIHPVVEPKTFRPYLTKENDWGIDREMQKNKNFSGIHGIHHQDMVVQESQGLIMDRTQERLGSADAGVIQVRRLLIRLARELQEGKEPYAAANPDLYYVRGGIITIDKELQIPITELIKERLTPAAR